MPSIPDGATEAVAGVGIGGTVEAATGGLSTAAAMVGDVVAGVVPEFIQQFIPFLGTVML
ncbi:hypothetical protein [Halobellus ordinarius]|uniref:hypothetical protein n=1 Tax=Halobellus ordinarius TaxID=3075120 RepID=UPI00288082EA|nr:hypothetical protein [Halobellus sp. ZY16]